MMMITFDIMSIKRRVLARKDLKATLKYGAVIRLIIKLTLRAILMIMITGVPLTINQ